MEFIEKPNDTKIGEKWAVIIGISKYKDSRLDLKYADRDAQEFYDILTTKKDGYFEPKNIFLLLNQEASRTNIYSALGTFLQKSATDDLVLIYFACHGSPDPARPQNLYILPYEADINNFSGTCLPMWYIENSINDNLNAKRVVIIADACHSAAIGGKRGRRGINSTKLVNNYFKKLNASIEGTALLTSAEAMEVALEGEQWGEGHGVFTHYLIDGIKGEADGYGGGEEDGIISIGELFDYVSDKVREATNNKQHPLIGSKWYDRDLPLVYVESLKEEKFVELLSENCITNQQAKLFRSYFSIRNRDKIKSKKTSILLLQRSSF